MSNAWKKLDLAGEGLQSANMKLVEQMKQRKLAYQLLAIFPLGLHRDYLDEVRGAWVYRLATIAIIALLILGKTYIALALLAAISAFAIYDIRWIEDRVAAINKALRIAAYKSKPATQMPKNYRGRYTDEGLDEYLQVKEQERGGHVLPGKDPALNSRSRAPSFAEQEAMLNAMAKAKTDKSSQ
ncbi:MAG: TM2 domain-containing protein [Sulfuriferula sp.]|nr:TM2 domain-containing protein [Sulfuriferula sp.]